MEFLVFILLVVVGAIFVLPIVSIVIATNRARELREQMADLMERFRDLEAQVQRLAAERSAPAAQSAPAAIKAQAAPVAAATAPTPETKIAAVQPPLRPEPIEDTPKAASAPPAPEPKRTEATLRTPAGAPFLPAVPQIPTKPAAAPAPIPPAPQAAPPKPLFDQSTGPTRAAETAEDKAARAERAFSLEERLGANWLNKLGIALLVLGVAFFLAWKLQTWGPAGKVLCGFAVSAILLGGGVWLERKPTYRIFARAGIGGGWALGFFTTFAMHHIAAARVLPSLVADLVLMLLVVAGMVAHSLRYRSQAVTGLAFLLGFATLLTSHLQATEGTVVFSLTGSAVLAVGLVVVTAIRHWAALETAGVIAVYGSHFVWLTRVLPDNHASFAEFWPSVILIVLYWAIFRAAYVLRTPLDQKEENISSVAAILNASGVLALLKYQSAHPEWAWWALAALGTTEMALAFAVRARRRQAFVVLSTVGSVLLIAAVPFKFHGVSWPVLWLVEAQALALCGLRIGEPVFRRLGLLAGLATGVVLVVHDVVPLLLLRLDTPDPNVHVSLTVALALAAVLYWVHAEVYPRRWPQISESRFEAAALKVTSYLGAAAGASALWVALPDTWLPVGWLALYLVLTVLALRFRVDAVLLQADLLSLAAAAVLIFEQVVPLAAAGMSSSSSRRHPLEATVFALAALAYWIRGELLPRAPGKFAVDAEANPEIAAWERFMVPAASCLGAAAGAASLWVALPPAWIVVGWLVLSVLLGFAADKAKSPVLAFEADLLALAAVVGWFPWDLWNGGGGWWARNVPELAAVALLYAGMARKTAPEGLRVPGAGAYSWAASALLAIAAYDLSAELYLVMIWAALGVALFEAGRLLKQSALRWQGLAFAGMALGKCLCLDIESGQPPPLLDRLTPFSMVNSLLLEVLVLAAAGYWLLERTLNRERCSKAEHVAGALTDGLGTLALALWFAYRFPSPWVPVVNGAAWVTVIWAGMATILMALAWLMRRHTFVVWAVALAVAVVVRGIFLDTAMDSTSGFWSGSLFHLGVAALVLLAALPFAFKMRNAEFWESASISIPEELGAALLRRPEQWFFFAPFCLMVVALAVKLSSGHITIAWSLVGLVTFLFALVVGERSYRLAGLALLLVSVVKILLMDVWALAPADRYMTLIIMGLALLGVSFLYTKFGSVIRKYL